ncbi:hypothetical protein [uncultured Roseobacter sp.]|uniref:NYN domain-containing protein n=1 Tax=uncultured Roseobacter sp. TaxID=114847 RepID=UPI002605A709|nr:hypothetical protein [uncultured Roseobacter sp.]
MTDLSIYIWSLGGVTAVLAFLVAWLLHHKRKVSSAKSLIIDGSNVMHWKSNTPDIQSVVGVIEALTRQGFYPGVVFDANAGYLVAGKYRHHGDFARMLGLPEKRVMVVPKGTPADPIILQAARDMGARIVTNDRFRDWIEDYPEIQDDGYLIRGGYQSEQVYFSQALKDGVR